MMAKAAIATGVEDDAELDLLRIAQRRSKQRRLDALTRIGRALDIPLEEQIEDLARDLSCDEKEAKK